MKLQTTKLCVNCESLYEEFSTCPYCGSEVFIWLFRALGTVLEENPEQIDQCSLAVREAPASRTPGYLSDSPAVSFGERIMRGRSVSESRIALGRWGREMVRVLTFGIMHAYK